MVTRPRALCPAGPVPPPPGEVAFLDAGGLAPGTGRELIRRRQGQRSVYRQGKGRGWISLRGYPKAGSPLPTAWIAGVTEDAAPAPPSSAQPGHTQILPLSIGKRLNATDPAHPGVYKDPGRLEHRKSTWQAESSEGLRRDEMPLVLTVYPPKRWALGSH